MSAAIPKTRLGEPVFLIKQNATRPMITYQTVDEDQQLVPITGATAVQFAFRPAANAPGVGVIVHSATIVDPDNGQVSYQWQPTDTATPGDYYAVWRVTFSDGTEQTFPINNYQKFTVEAEL